MLEKTHWTQKASKGEETLFTEAGIPGKDLTPSVLEDHLSLNSTLIRPFFFSLPPFFFHSLTFLLFPSSSLVLFLNENFKDAGFSVIEE